MTEEMSADAHAVTSPLKPLQVGYDFFPLRAWCKDAKEISDLGNKHQEDLTLLFLFLWSQEEVMAEAQCRNRLSPPLEALHHPTACHDAGTLKCWELEIFSFTSFKG